MKEDTGTVFGEISLARRHLVTGKMQNPDRARARSRGLKAVLAAFSASLALSIFPLFMASASQLNGARYIGRSCGKTVVVRDYLAPLEHLPQIDEPSEFENIPFAPRRVSIGISGNQLIVGGGKVGFALRDEAFNHVRNLNWIVATELVRINRKGKVIARFGVKRSRLESAEINGMPPFLRYVPAKPGYYRVDIRFHRSLSGRLGRLLGVYSLYARAVSAREGLRMEIDTPIVAPGNYARAALVNLGTVPIEFPRRSVAFSVQMFVDGKWSRVAPNPRELVPKIRRRSFVLPPGTRTTGCYLVPGEQAPGLFRFRALWKEARTAPFEVVGPRAGVEY